MKLFTPPNLRFCYKVLSFQVLLSLLLQICLPTISFGLTSGPTQPEVHGFTPIGTTEMVDAFTGDFNYNIPLLDVDGYPVNLSYRSGVGMEDEASWVGLGWSLNVGVVNRSMRGLPDDFKGDEITKVQNMKPTRTIGLGGGLSGIEIFGLDPSQFFGIQANASVGINFNNYNGFGFEKSVSLSINASRTGSSPLTGHLGLSSDTNEGISLQPSLSLQARGSDANQAKPGVSIGTSFNSRFGLKQLSITTSLQKKSLAFSTASVSKSYDLGSPTYSPSASMNMKNFSISGRFTIGSELFGINPNAFINAYYSSQSMDGTTTTNPAYGYIYSASGQEHDDALLDFNREKEVPFAGNLEVLPVTNFTYDIYSISGQGVGGSYRSFRGDVGTVFDPRSQATSDGFSVGVELGVGDLMHDGGNISINTVNSTTGGWSSSGAFSFQNRKDSSLYEDAYFKEASESSVNSDPEWLNRLGGYSAVKPGLSGSGYDVSLDYSLEGGGASEVSSSKRSKRDNRNQLMSTLTWEEVQAGYGLFGANYYTIAMNAAAQPHHIAQITSLGNDGGRYVYAQPLYNTIQKEVTFAVGKAMTGSLGIVPDCSSSIPFNNLIDYNATDASINNTHGLDNFYQETTTPAYAHAYLLSAHLSADYVDSDNIDGPSLNDLGSYTLFKYSYQMNYNWRAPFETKANFSDGVRIDPSDDKASYIYGEKEQRYLSSIETKNYVAVFTTEARDDAFGVNGETGGLSTSSASLRLNRIDLYTRAEYDRAALTYTTPTPIKTVHFEYTYELCFGVPNSSTGQGKLTLKKVYFTFQNSNRGKLSPYEFEYSHNPVYNRLSVDRWGNYKPSPNCYLSPNAISNADFPYVDQSVSDLDAADFAAAWSLTNIKLPSGGDIAVLYEPDEYAYVQNKPAMEMFKIIGSYENDSDFNLPDSIAAIEIDPDESLLFKLPTQNAYGAIQFLNGINSTIYLRCMVNLKPGNLELPTYENPGSFEPIPIYANQSNLSIKHLDTNSDAVPDLWVGCVKLSKVSFKDEGPLNRSPISKAALQYGRLNAPRIVYDENGDMPDMSQVDDIAISFLEELGNFISGTDILELFQSPNGHLYSGGLGHKILTEKSFVRLSHPTGHKRGGGSRVRLIRISDQWDTLSGASTATSQVYGKTYDYNYPGGGCSGVASYEPMLGADENPFRMPIEYTVNNILAPDEAHFLEQPIGESFYPSPVVGYSRVTVTDYLPGDVTTETSDDLNVHHHGTGKIVQEFYTAKDFPVIVNKTDLNLRRTKTNPFSIASLFNINSKDHVTASQGFSVELNDMHGKQKSQKIYKEYSNDPISSVEYSYQMTGSPDNTRLDNTVNVIDNNGILSSADIGVHFDMVADTRESYSETEGGGISGNGDAFSIPPIIPFLAIPSFWPNFSHEETVFRSATATKVIQRFAVLHSVKATDNTSVVETKNLAYDAITGDVLVTQTINNYNDSLYTVTYPAHWVYDGMGPASRNIGFNAGLLVFVSGYTGGPEPGSAHVLNAHQYFSEGDEISTEAGIAWVIKVTDNVIVAIAENGSPLVGNYHVKVIRSGRRNMSNTPISQITLLSNPLEHFSSNIFEKVLEASAVEFSDDWTTFCDCFSDDKINFTTINPYQTGTKGVWRPTRNYTYLTDRIQAYYNYNTDVRRDGIFQSFSPFYSVDNGLWAKVKANWTWASEITSYSPNGQEVENKDALGRYSAAHFGYKHTLPIAVAANASYADIGFNNFEDYHGSNTCGTSLPFAGGILDSTRSHTGRHCLKVLSGDTSVVFGFTTWSDCDRDTGALTLTATSSTSITIGQGSGSYMSDIEVYTGDCAITNIVGNVITISTSTIYSIKVTVIDSEGKQASIFMHNP